MWLNVMLTFKTYQRAARGQTEWVGVVRMPPKQKLLLAPLQEFIWSLPIGAYKKLQWATVMMKPCKDLRVPEEWLAALTLSKVSPGKVLVHLINLGTTPVPLPKNTTIADLCVVLIHYLPDWMPCVPHCKLP